ncbi:MAG: sigma-54-dependent Fis family transcriptional regulator, partial [Alphaproteobacteria bacterium]
DIPVLAEHFARKYADLNNLPYRALDDGALAALSAHRWQGNVRELENAMHRAVLLATGSAIGAEAIMLPDGSRPSGAAGTAAVAGEQDGASLVGRTVAEVERDLILDTLHHCVGNRTHAANILGISIRTLRNKLNQYQAEGVPVPAPGDAQRAVG